MSRVLVASSGGALVARFGEIWSLETEGACRVCPRLFIVAVAHCCLSQLSCNLPVPMSAPNPGRFLIVVSVSWMHFSSSGGVLGNVNFGELRAGLSSSYVTALLFAGGAAHPVRCFAIAHALCLLL